MSTLTAQTYLTPEEYLTWERKQSLFHKTACALSTTSAKGPNGPITGFSIFTRGCAITRVNRM